MTTGFWYSHEGGLLFPASAALCLTALYSSFSVRNIQWFPDLYTSKRIHIVFHLLEARMLWTCAGILGEMQAVQQARAEEVHFSAPVWLKLLDSSPPQNDSGRLRHC